MKCWAIFALVGIAAGCGGRVVIDSGTGGEGGQGGSPVNAPACNSGEGAVLAIDKLFMGDTDPNGTPNPVNAWKQYGINLDGDASTASSTNLCKPILGASVQAVQPDGNDGRDNSFGKNVLPIFLGLDANASQAANNAIQKGLFTWLLSAPDLGQGATCSTSLQMLLGAQAAPPQWNGKDTWPIDPSSLQNPSDPTSAKWVFPENIIDSQNVLVSKEPGTMDLVFFLAGRPMRLAVHHAFLKLTLSPDHTSASSGMLGGILDPNELTSKVLEIAGSVDPSLCDPNSPTMASILSQLRQASDILLDGTQDPNKECNGISIGVGFTMKAMNLGGIGAAVPPPPNPCP